MGGQQTDQYLQYPNFDASFKVPLVTLQFEHFAVIFLANSDKGI